MTQPLVQYQPGPVGYELVTFASRKPGAENDGHSHERIGNYGVSLVGLVSGKCERDFVIRDAEGE